MLDCKALGKSGFQGTASFCYRRGSTPALRDGCANEQITFMRSSGARLVRKAGSAGSCVEQAAGLANGIT